jgi:hypothetical protein
MVAKLFRLAPDLVIVKHSAAPDETTVVVDELPKQCECGGDLCGPMYGLGGGGFGLWSGCESCDRIYKVIDSDPPARVGGEPPEWARHDLEPNYVWCTACHSDLCLEGVEWPDPTEHEPGEVVEIWVSCYVDFDDGEQCDEEVLVYRRVNAAGDGYEGQPMNLWPRVEPATDARPR